MTENRRILILDKEQEKAFLEQERLAAIGRVARSVGHEFGNILQPLLAQLDIAREKIQKGDIESLDSSLTEMIEVATLGAMICQDLLTFSHESYSLPTDSVRPISVLKTIQKALRLLRHEIKQHDIHIDIQVAENLIVLFQESELIQVLVNLIKNSIDALSDGGQIQIRGSSDSTQTLLEIQDTGAGIPESHLSQLFQPLFTTKGIRGNGIGLATCKEIMEKHSGEISISSQVGKGTTVTLKYPLPF